MAKLRKSTHPLEVEVGRYHRPYVERKDRLCKICNSGEVEDEKHFLTSCSFYKSERRYVVTKLNEFYPDKIDLFDAIYGKKHNAVHIRIACNFVKTISEKRSDFSRSNPDSSRFSHQVTRYGRVSRPPQRLIMELKM